MCDPVSLSIAATGMSVLGAVTQGMQQSAYYKYQAKQGEADASAARGAAIVRAEKVRRAGALNQGQAKASIAASGLDTDAGTSVEINNTIAKNTESDALTEILDGNNQSARLNAQAEADRISASNARTNSYLSAGSSLISAANLQGWKTSTRTASSSSSGSSGGIKLTQDPWGKI